MSTYDDPDLRRSVADNVAQRFHEAYERLAPEHGYQTRPESAVPWEDVPANNKALMRSVVLELADQGVIDVW